MPPDQGGFEIATDWTVIRIEEHRQTRILIAYHYLCPNCTMIFQPRQTTLIPSTTSIDPTKRDRGEPP